MGAYLHASPAESAVTAFSVLPPVVGLGLGTTLNIELCAEACIRPPHTMNSKLVNILFIFGLFPFHCPSIGLKTRMP